MTERWSERLLRPHYYNFDNIWRFRAPVDAIWQALRDWQSWPAWWDGALCAQQVRSPVIGKKVGRIVWKAPMDYLFITDLRQTRLSEPTELAADSYGDLVGPARWQLSMRDGITTVRFTWGVHTTKWWTVLLAPVARSVFIWNHDELMRRGAQGLARHLKVPLLEPEG